MLRRKAYDKLAFWKKNKTKQGLLVTGARQVGKTFLIREFAKQNYGHCVEINLIENRRAAASLNEAETAQDLLLRISLLANTQLIPGETIIFIDEVQNCKEMVTAIKFLVEQSDYDFVLSGSLLGVELANIRSVPVGYLDTVNMYPLDFEEFLWATGITNEAFERARDSFINRRPLPDFIHESLIKAFYKYLITGGMPEAVDAFCRSSNLQLVRDIQKQIIIQYKKDITQYNKENALIIKDIYDLMPSELNQKGKRFVVTSIKKSARFGAYETCFVWLANANVALPVYQVSSAEYPLLLYKSPNLFKLFMSDVGLLTSTFIKDTSLDILDRNPDINYGAIFENAVAQDLSAHEVTLYYYNNKEKGEVDFIIETPRGSIVPIEVKSGKSYKRHSALTNLLSVKNSRIPEAFVLTGSNLESSGQVTYLPVYMASFLSTLA